MPIDVTYFQLYHKLNKSLYIISTTFHSIFIMQYLVFIYSLIYYYLATVIDRGSFFQLHKNTYFNSRWITFKDVNHLHDTEG